MEKLYHYTSVDGFKSIIDNNAIRMTKSGFLNDPTDCRLFVTLVKKYLDTHPGILSSSISNLKYHNAEVEELYRNGKCDLIHYIEYIHETVSLYVMSLTQIDDGMTMWNYYGHGGMELELSTETLVNSIRQTFVSEKEFLTISQVIYANSELDVEKIKVPAFSKFLLMNNDSENIFKDHRSFIKKNSQYETAQLYSTTKLDEFIRIYLKHYVSTIAYLLNEKEIDTNTPPESIFSKIFDNTSKLNDYLYWKHDLSLYMLLLSALIKSDTYEYEHEHRIVYFEYSVAPQKNREKTEEYSMKHISSGDFICPYITFKGTDLLSGSLKGITISPISKNLPLNHDMYLNTLNQYLLSNHFDNTVSVKFSKHTIRW